MATPIATRIAVLAAKKPAAKTKKAASVAKSLHAHLVAGGFTKDGQSEDNEVGRYVKRGFYDGDYPNAHQTLIRHTHHNFSAADKDKAKFDSAVAYAKTLGFNGYTHKNTHVAYKNNHTVSVANKGGKTMVMHTVTTNKPDLAFERSGKGRGQII